MTGDPTEFSPAGYAALLAGLGDRGYAVRGFAEARQDERHLILRHDVDFSLAAAVAMAEQEAALGLAATYFVLLRTEFYNPMSGPGLEALRRLRALGHAVGLHFDAALYGDAEDLDAAAGRECGLLETVLGAEVPLVSLHRPGASGLVTTARLGGRLNAYGRRYCAPDRYCSDSRGRWAHGHPFAHAAIRAGRALQLLIHPFWWQAPPMPPSERLRGFLAERAAFLDGEVARHCTIHVPAS
jgi:hypothetical protein